MPALPIDTRRVRNRYFAFNPSGPLKMHGARTNPSIDLEGDTYACRIFVGFNVGKKPRWSMMDLLAIIRKIRAKQKVGPDATLYYTKGMFSGSGGLVEENGAQVLIINTNAKERPVKFEKNMKALAEGIVVAFDQEVIYGEIQKNGIQFRLWRSTP